MQTYTPPLRDMAFVLTELHDFSQLTALEAFSEVDADLAATVLEEGGKFTSEVLLPLNATGDKEGCTIENGVVRTPRGFKEAYRQFCEGGWSAVSAPPEFGGQGLPETIGLMISEMICATNLSFGLYPGLTGGATVALRKYGSDELKSFYLPKMISGEWSGSMCLTEAHCGTDLGLLRTRAVPQEDGSYRVSGSKIFISAGEHDLSDNIVHLVLARLPDAPPGIKGISLFLVPKFLPDENGAPGERNGVLCTGIEHKMGIKASATCQLAFDDAKGWLIGAPHKGMQAMFAMMNTERLGVGIQGLGIAETAYQSAVAYAKERLQGRSLAGAKHPELPADPIIVHPDVRRMLMTMRVNAEGCRALGAWVAMQLDISEHAADERQRRDAEDFVALMTPVVKAMFTDLGFESANLAVQTYGGHGYIVDHGVEQYVRDARIAMIYEGTNGVQALDLVGRKLPAHMGRNLRGFFHPIAAFIAENKENPMLGEMITGLERALGALQLSTAQIAERGMRDPEEAGAAATDYLRLMGLVGLAYLWAKAVVIAVPKSFAPGPDQAFYAAKISSARFFYERVLPESAALYLKIKSGKASMMALPDEAF
ncbi:acyl-CoA dehydrogenase C-terminal domain-containing protein [Acidomonas methanolica]|uniref:3-methylmercaptopropionyl-CoA dehydrogenase n=1 Tax=Acidomonas methanolica NBRC 104435 TaxID=1231351 RepID=A0A023D2C8_ACIMT|nr:acyl-CoA dehydrogenase C-terminal domain-containing protein [Acidomonas methanolica]MBU2654116.1 acyl-CoA dehydrogenase C-terminal domain-containing protein [Acidomonas methanolica]TCS30656.1 alkylation response protein AidB-like acyl-CoA dehydrogenase [Acidomonas methanolica]GAJ28214.1 acyl-CoA dehydrogenase [Acidomonas methanolica NBRC 104435]GBQ47233.1 acyl-CoA dehydrogenase [Acidomonas methanolica]GEK98956.1 acyl-CoA dehydrogenase [Acidomonas methanolica NBRC 104435]